MLYIEENSIHFWQKISGPDLARPVGKSLTNW